MNDLLLYLLKSGCCLTLLYAVYWVFLKRETFFKLNRFFLLISLFLALVVPLIHIPSPFRVIQIENTTAGISPVMTQQSQSIGATEIFLFIYLLGASIVIVQLMIQGIRIIYLIKSHSLKKYSGYRIVEIDGNMPPFSFFHFIFIHPSICSRYDLERIMAHEHAHLKQFHSIDIILMELVVLIQWWNPFVWPYRRSLRETHEFLADEAVIAQGCDTAAYQMLIVEQCVGQKLFALANTFHQSQIKRRILMMTKNKSRSWAKGKALFIIPTLGVLALAFARPRIVAPVMQETVKQEKKVKAKTVDAEKQELSKKEVEAKFTAMMQELKSAWKEAKTDDEKKEIEKKMKALKVKKAAYDKEMEASVQKVTLEDIDLKIKKLKEKYAQAETDDDKKKIKEYVAELQKKKEAMKAEMAAHEAMKEKEKVKKAETTEKSAKTVEM